MTQKEPTASVGTGKIVFGVAGGILVALLAFGLLRAIVEINHDKELEEQAMAEQDKECIDDIEAIAIALEQYFYPKYGYYPKEVSEEVITIISPSVFVDPEGKHINDKSSRYSYESSGCNEDKCTAYKITAKISDGGTASIDSTDL